MDVLGVDGARGGWVAVRLLDGTFAGASHHTAFEELIREFPGVDAVAVDIPIGPPDRGVRPADEEARKRLGPQARSVFTTPPRAALEEPDFRKASAPAQQLGGRITKQGHALRLRILEVDRTIERHPEGKARIVEVHPEVSFWAMNGEKPVAFPKRTWNGFMERLELLRGHGIELPSRIHGIGRASAADVLDAAAAAWSAWRVARGEAGCLPDVRREGSESPRGVIWY